jgi:PIN domain nuclease of toxin-antitoxin system
MAFIIDTQAFIWHATGDSKLSRRARQIIESDEVCLISAASIWEMAIKYNLGNLVITEPFADLINGQISSYEYTVYPIELRHIFLISSLERHHKDPFDRLIIAQSIVDNIPVVSIDSIFDDYSVKRIW